MKALLVSVNSRYIHSSLAVWYLKAACDTCDVDIIETTIKSDKKQLISDIGSSGAVVVAFSCYIWNMPFVGEVIEELKAVLPSIKLVLGGPEVSYNAREVFAKYPQVDYIISGEGERAFAELVSAIASGSNTDNIDGVCTMGDIKPPCICKNDPKSPYTAEYFQRLNNRITYIETSRGCPYSCSYCLSGRMGGVRFFDMQTVKSNIDMLAKSGTQTIKFVDRTFNCNAKRAVEILQYIVEQNPAYTGVCYHFEMAGDIITPELQEVLASAPAGLFQIEVGVQSFNENTLMAVNRKTNLQTVADNLSQIIARGNIHVHMDLIAGLPQEGYESFRTGFDELFALRPHMLQLGFLKRLHGSDLKEQDCGNFSDTPPYEVIDTPWISADELDKLRAVEDAVDRLYNTARFKTLVYAGIEKKGSAFELFLDFGMKNIVSYGEKLDDFSRRVLDYFSCLLGERVARDIMKEQWLKVNASGRLPLCLKEESMRAVQKEIARLPEHYPRKAVKRAAAILHTTQEIIYVDYIDKDPVTGEYSATKIPMELIHRQDILDKQQKF